MQPPREPTKVPQIALGVALGIMLFFCIIFALMFAGCAGCAALVGGAANSVNEDMKRIEAQYKLDQAPKVDPVPQ